MKTHAIAALFAAVSLSAFAQPGATLSGSPTPESPRADVSQTAHRALDATTPASSFMLAKIYQNNTPPDRGGEPGKSRSGRM
jgi:hypothetical protein